MVGLHGLELLVGVGDTVSAVGLDQILAEAEAAAMPALRIVDDLASPGVHHAAEDARVLGASDTLVREHLGIVAADMLHYPQRFAGHVVYEIVLGLGSDFVAELVYKVTGVSQVFRFVELPPAGLPEILADACFEFRELAPGLEDLGVVAERGDAGSHEVLVSRFLHQGELPGDDGHRRLLGDGVAVIGYASASGMVLRLVDILA